MDVKELAHELEDLKTKAGQQHQMIMLLLSGGVGLNKRCDMLEALAQAQGELLKAQGKLVQAMHAKLGTPPPPPEKPPGGPAGRD